MSRKLLERVHLTSLSATHREHVTLAVVEGVVPATIHACIAPSELARPDLRFDVDVPEDLAKLERLVTSGCLTPDSSAVSVVEGADRLSASERS